MRKVYLALITFVKYLLFLTNRVQKVLSGSLTKLVYRAHNSLPELEREKDKQKLQMFLWKKGFYP
jgi:hypothetical protein